MKNIILLLLILFIQHSGNILSAQSTLAPSLLAPGGGITETPAGSLSWSIGEIAVDHVVASDKALTQGFQQSESDSAVIVIPEEDAKSFCRRISNALTPNGDGNNDLFDPAAELNAPGFFVPESQIEYYVLNRWGELVFSAMPYRAFEGKDNRGNKLPQSTYYAILRIKADEKIEAKCVVHLLR